MVLAAMQSTAAMQSIGWLGCDRLLQELPSLIAGSRLLASALPGCVRLRSRLEKQNFVGADTQSSGSQGFSYVKTDKRTGRHSVQLRQGPKRTKWGGSFQDKAAAEKAAARLAKASSKKKTKRRPLAL